ncbi:hypothetical protein Peur_017813 [Populus x canadensis]
MASISCGCSAEQGNLKETDATAPITSTDGYSCSGQIPDIAWQKFQKNCCPHTKTWHGKRFSCKIDGIEVFGFKNPCPEVTSRTEQNNRSPDACTHPDLLPYLPRSRVKGKGREIANKFFAVANIFIQYCLLAFIFC